MLDEQPRFECLLRVRAPQELVDAVDAAARAKFMTISEYLRQSLLKSLYDDAVSAKPVKEAA